MGDKGLILLKGLIHFTITFEDPAFIDDQARGQEVSVKLPRRLDFDPPLRMEVSFDGAADDDGMDFNFAFDNRRFTHDEDPALEDFSLEFAFQSKHALKGHLSFKGCLLSQEGADILRNRGRFGPALCEERFSSRHNGLLFRDTQNLNWEVKDKVEVKTEIRGQFP